MSQSSTKSNPGPVVTTAITVTESRLTLDVQARGEHTRASNARLYRIAAMVEDVTRENCPTIGWSVVHEVHQDAVLIEFTKGGRIEGEAARAVVRTDLQRLGLA